MSVRSGLAVVLSLATLLAGVGGGLGAGTALAGDVEATGFTADERAKLLRGELVERRTRRDQGGMRLMGGSSWQLIDSPPEVVWQALLDTRHYPRFLPQVAEAKLVGQTGDTRKVFVRHGGLASASYYVSLRVETPMRELRFRVEDSGAVGVRAAWGHYSLRPYTPGKTLLAFGVMADIGDGLITALVRGQVHEWMMKVPWMVKRFVEGSGRYIYKTTPQLATSGR